MDKYGKKLTSEKIYSKIYKESYILFAYLTGIRDLMIKAFAVNLGDQAYQDLLEVKEKAAAAIKIKSDNFSTQLKAYEYQLYEFMESLDNTMYDDCISACGERFTMSDFNNETCTIIKGWFWIYLIDRLENKIKEDKRHEKLKGQRKREEEKRKQKAPNQAIKKLKKIENREDELAKHKKVELVKESKIKVKEETQKRINEFNQNFENNIIKKIKENESNTDKILMTIYLKAFYYL